MAGVRSDETSDEPDRVAHSMRPQTQERGAWSAASETGRPRAETPGVGPTAKEAMSAGRVSPQVVVAADTPT